MKTVVSEYEQQAINFLEATSTALGVAFLRNDFYFSGDESKRDIYRITIKSGDRSYSFNFGQSIAKSTKYKDKLNGRVFTSSGQSAGGHSFKHLHPEQFPASKKLEVISDFKIIDGEQPTAYDILAGLQKYDVGSFGDFCGDFGYSNGSIIAKKIYKSVCKEYDKVCSIWSALEIEQLRDIS